MRSISDILNRYFGSMPPSSQDDTGQALDLFSSWQRIAGQDLAAHSRIADIRKGSVLVYCDHQGWMQKLGFHKKRLLASLQKAFPELKINNLMFQVVDAERMASGDFEKERENFYEKIRIQRAESRKRHLEREEAQKGRQEPKGVETETKLETLHDTELKERLKRFMKSAE